MRRLNLKIRRWQKMGFISIILLCFGLSCSKVTESNINKSTNEFEEVFNQFWLKMNSHYVYWDIDNTDWDKMYNLYKPHFKNLDINNDSDVKKSVSYFRKMTQGLIDGHYSINFLHKSLMDSTIFPAYENKLNNPGYHHKFNYTTLLHNYLDDNYLSASIYDPVSRQTVRTITGTIDSNILYFHCNYFALARLYENKSADGIRNALDYFFSKLKQNDHPLTGIIIDVRGNRGGDLIDLSFLLKRLNNNPFTFGYTKYKVGKGKQDYSGWLESSINESENNINCPIIVLVDNFSASLSETIAMAINTIPNGSSVGETTWGATGPISDSEVFYSGSFTISNFLSVNTSSVSFKYIDEKYYEGIGFTPNHTVLFDLPNLNNGIDSCIIKAIGLIVK